MDMILGTLTCECKCQNSNLIFSNLCCRYTLELPHIDNSNVYLQHMSFQSFLKTNSQKLLLF